MIKFFRKIRYDLMEKNKTGKYFKYAIGEIILIVIGILIALSINNWNETRKTRNSEQLYLAALKEEFSFNKIELERVMKDNVLNSEYAKKILDITGPESVEITEDEFATLLINSIPQKVQFDPSQGIIDEIISSGKLGMFRSEKLRYLLSSWSGFLERVRLEEEELLNMRSRTIELMRNKANIRMGLGSRLESFGIKPTKFKQGQLHMLKSVVFEGHIIGIATMSWSLNNTHYPNLIEKMDEILLLIDNEIN